MDRALTIATVLPLDQAGDIYLACHSDSSEFPYLTARPTSRSRGDMDALIIKVAARTGRVVWATRTGGNLWDGGGEIEIGRDGSAYVLGSTQSADFATTPDAIQRLFAGPDRDAFLLKLDRTGRIVYSTLLGGPKNDEASDMCVTSNGTVFIGGVTMSGDFPGNRIATFGTRGGPDGFITKPRPGDPNSVQTILLGGSGTDQIAALGLNRTGNLFAAGYTSSANFPIKNAAQIAFRRLHR